LDGRLVVAVHNESVDAVLAWNAAVALVIELVTIWDRCHDFLNIFAEKFGKKIGVFESKHC
jgi:hypothetical protein